MKNNNLHWQPLFYALQLEVNDFSELILAFQQRRKPRRFSKKMTIQQALQFHPEAKNVFEDHGLPRCSKCSVRFEETLQEAADVYDINLSVWLFDLNRLLLKNDVSRM
jgi:hypothetical protein